MGFVAHAVIAGLVVATASWLANRFPTPAGFLVALPLSSMLLLPMAHLQHGRVENSFLLAKSIMLAVPIVLVFFLPFLVAARLGISFWPTYLVGCALLPVGFLVHQWFARLIWT